MADLVMEVWSDVLCPWCFIGSRHLTAARERTDHEVEVVWRAFQLDPGLGTEAEPNRDRLVAKFGGEQNYRAASERVASVGATVGIDFDHDRALAVSTLRAHQLVAASAGEGKADETVAALFSAQFEQGADVADPATLHRVADDVGMADPDAAVEAVLADAHLPGVRADIADAAQLGIRGVPTFVAERRVGVSGAVPPETLEALFDQALGYQYSS